MRFVLASLLALLTLFKTVGFAWYFLSDSEDQSFGTAIAVAGTIKTLFWFWVARLYRWQWRGTRSAAGQFFRFAKIGAIAGATIGVVAGICIFAFGSLTGEKEEVAVLSVVTVFAFLVSIFFFSLALGLCMGALTAFREWCEFGWESRGEGGAWEYDPRERPGAICAVGLLLLIQISAYVCVIAFATKQWFPSSASYNEHRYEGHNLILVIEIVLAVISGVGVFLGNRWLALNYVVCYSLGIACLLFTIGFLPLYCWVGVTIFCVNTALMLTPRARGFFLRNFRR